MKEISTIELQEMLNAGETPNLVDVREDDEVAEGMIPGAVHIPMGNIVERIAEFNKTEPYIFICRSGGRSGQVTEYLEEQGYDVTNMAGGMLEWEGETE